MKCLRRGPCSKEGERLRNLRFSELRGHCGSLFSAFGIIPGELSAGANGAKQIHETTIGAARGGCCVLQCSHSSTSPGGVASHSRSLLEDLPAIHDPKMLCPLCLTRICYKGVGCRGIIPPPLLAEGIWAGPNAFPLSSFHPPPTPSSVPPRRRRMGPSFSSVSSPPKVSPSSCSNTIVSAQVTGLRWATFI